MAMDETISSERRNFARVQLAKLAVVEQPDAPPTPAVIVDVSERGARLKMPQAPSEATQYFLHFKLNGAPHAMRFTVVRSGTFEGQHQWGCVFKDASSDEVAKLRHAVYALFGRPHVRPWQDIKRECQAQSNGKILVGCTSDGKEVFIASRDCLHLGTKGVQQFVMDVEDAAHPNAAPSPAEAVEGAELLEEASA